MTRTRHLLPLGILAASLLSGCVVMPTAGPTLKEIDAAGQNQDAAAEAAIQVVEVDGDIARRLQAQRRQKLFSEVLVKPAESNQIVGLGDTLEVNIWEAPPATLFTSATSSDPRSGAAGARITTLPEQIVDRDGSIAVPFAGRIPAVGRPLAAIEAEIVKNLAGKAHQPEVLIRRIRNRSATVTVVGEVAASVNLPLTPSGERLLDALAAAGGVRQPVSKTTIQITRGSQYTALPLETVIRDPLQNVPLQAGDVVTAMFQPLSFTVLGATGKNEEINFEAQGITLAQAIARAGGLQDFRADAQGVFVFRLEPESALKWPRQPVATTPDGQVPVVYRLDLKKPSSFFVMQSFAVQNKDIVYVSNAPAAELQKFLGLVFSITYPILNTIQVTK